MQTKHLIPFILALLVACVWLVGDEVEIYSDINTVACTVCHNGGTPCK